MRTDTQLLEAYVDRGDRSAFDQLVARHYPHVYQVVLRLVHNEFDARDLSQNVFVKALRKADQVRDRSRFKGWLLRVAVNEVRSHWRRRSPPAQADELQLAFQAARGAEAQTEASRREFELELERALEHMPAHLKTPLVLYYYQSLSLAEVGEILGLAKSTVQHRVNKAVARLRRRFAKRNAAVLLPMLAVRFPGIPTAEAASTGVASVLTGGSLAVKTKITIAAVSLAALLLIGLAAGVFDPAEDVHAADPAEMADTDATENGAALEGRGEDGAAAPAPTDPTVTAEPVPVINSTGPGRIVGHVLSKTTGKGIAGVRVVLSIPATSENRIVTDLHEEAFENVYWTDADGAFVCDQLPTAHQYALVFQHLLHGYQQLSQIAFRAGSNEVDLGAVVMAPAVELTGRVVDTADAPIRGVQITVGDPRTRPMPVGFHHAPDRLRGAVAHTDAQGRFKLVGLSEGYHRLVARKPGFATTALGEVYVARPALPLRVRMEASTPLRIEVVDPSGAPIAGARVNVTLDESVRAGRQGFTRRFTWILTQSDAGGVVEVDDLPAGPGLGYVIEVTRGGYTDFYEDVGPTPSSPFRVTLQPTVEERGFPVRVALRGANGEPLDGLRGRITISGMNSSGGDFMRQLPIDTGATTTVIDGVPPREQMIHVQAKGYRSAGKTIEIPGSPVDVELTLERGAVARGVVVDAATRKPIAGARVAENQINAVDTDRNGRFELSGLQGGRTIFGAMRVTAPGYLDTAPTLRFAEGAQELEMRVELQPVSALRRIAGRVVAADGTPVPGALLGIELSSPSVYTLRARSGIDGRFVFTGIRPDHMTDTMRLRVVHADFAGADLELTPAATEEPVEVRLATGRTVRGRVVDEAGVPVVGASVGALSTDRWWKIEGDRIGGTSMDSWTYRILPYLAGSTSTDAEGRFALTHMPEDALQVVAFGRMSTWLVENGKTGAYLARGAGDVDGVEIRVRRGWALKGRVVDAAGAPVNGVRVAAEGVLVATFTDAAGRFDLSPVFRDDTVIRVRDDDYGAEVLVTKGEGEGLRIEARARTVVSGRVVEADGTPVAGAIVTLEGSETGPADTTSEDGTFTLRNMPAGSCALLVAHEGERPRGARVELVLRHKQENEAGDVLLK